MKTKRLVTTLLSVVLMTGIFTLQTSAADYNFTTGYQDDTFARSTTSDVPPDTSGNLNVRRDKDSAFFPPSYGIFSGEIPTDPTSPYHTQDRFDAVIISYNNTAYYGQDTSAGFIVPTSTTMTAGEIEAINSNAGGSNVSVSYSGTPQTETYTPVLSVAPYTDGSIGSLSIPDLKLNVRVYEGTDLETLKKGVGHFSFTSQWTGNVAMASHNRGNASYFSGIWNLKKGEKIIYTTSEGTRTYYVYNVVKVDETDLSFLVSTRENTLTLTTCVIDESAYRWVVQARE